CIMVVPWRKTKMRIAGSPTTITSTYMAARHCRERSSVRSIDEFGQSWRHWICHATSGRVVGGYPKWGTFHWSVDSITAALRLFTAQTTSRPQYLPGSGVTPPVVPLEASHCRG